MSATGDTAVYHAGIMPDQGDAGDPDDLQLQFYGSGFQAGLNGEDTGTFDLTQGGDDNFATCSRCVLLIGDPTNVGTTFFQSGGTLVIDPSSDQMNGGVTATMTDVTLVEVTIDPNTFESTPVPGGACVHITSANVSVIPPVVPPGWTCNPAYYADGSCDCGCGVTDTDCADMTVGSCQYCDDSGSCSFTSCPGTIDPNDNSICTPSNVPPTWTCNPAYYGDGSCDCGCGAADTDCADMTIASCEYCDDTGSCSTDACPGTIDPNNNSTCTP